MKKSEIILDRYVELYFTVKKEYKLLCKFCEGDLYFETINNYIEHSINKHSKTPNMIPQTSLSREVTETYPPNACQCLSNHEDGLNLIIYSSTNTFEIHCCKCRGHFVFNKIEDFIAHSLERHMKVEQSVILQENKDETNELSISSVAMKTEQTDIEDPCLKTSNVTTDAEILTGPSTSQNKVQNSVDDSQLIRKSIDTLVKESNSEKIECAEHSKSSIESETIAQSMNSNGIKENSNQKEFPPTKDSFKPSSFSSDILSSETSKNVKISLSANVKKSRLVVRIDREQNERCSKRARKSETSDTDISTIKKTFETNNKNSKTKSTSSTSNEGNKFCKICSKSFVRSSDYELHMKNYHPATECHICNIKFQNAEEMLQHLERHKTDAQCPICYEAILWYTKRHLNKHFKLLSCNKCEFLTCDKNVFQTHKQTCGQFVCKVCNSTCGDARNYRRHALSIHKNREPFECIRCEEKFQYLNAMEAHQKLCPGSRE